MTTLMKASWALLTNLDAVGQLACSLEAPVPAKQRRNRRSASERLLGLRRKDEGKQLQRTVRSVRKLEKQIHASMSAAETAEDAEEVYWQKVRERHDDRMAEQVRHAEKIRAREERKLELHALYMEDQTQRDKAEAFLNAEGYKGGGPNDCKFVYGFLTVRMEYPLHTAIRQVPLFCPASFAKQLHFKSPC
eukprot:TRINITY_DN18387_c0_g1_i3.p1 TRINITY_DN18387_c0_g1~~TRINITY_DN18387_c0_g1_i3.p1  ORF type:complete len:191 (+),score=50.70 TRINITY_DN18387_c0_g1_i3:70-642(+)